MEKIKKWLNRPKKEAENLMIHAVTSEKTHHDSPVITEMLKPTQPSLLDIRAFMQGDMSQRQEVLTSLDNQRQECPEHPRILLDSSSATSGSLPVQHLSGEGGEQIYLSSPEADPGLSPGPAVNPAGGGASNRESRDIINPGLPVQLFQQRKCDLSLPSSPYTGEGRRRSRLPSSLPCSPLLGGRSSPPSPSVLSRFWVEAALQRSKNIQRTRRPPQVREGQEVENSMRGGMEKREWSDDEEEEDDVQKTADDVGIRLSNNIVFRSLMSPMRGGRDRETEDEDREEDPDFLSLHSGTLDYCLLTPCVCSRCPSAPPYEADTSPPPEDQNGALTGPSPRTDDQRTDDWRTGDRRTDDRWTGLGQEQGAFTEGVPQLGHSSRLYPSLSLWRIMGNTQEETNEKQEVNQLNQNTTLSCNHGNNTDGHLKQLQGSSERPVELCVFCSDELTVMKHVCQNCNKVFCCRCLSHSTSLLQIHQFRQAAAV